MGQSSIFPVRSISVAAPAYNEAEGIEQVLLKWIEYLKQVPNLRTFEIVICNDGSVDKTGEILDALAKRYPVVRPVHLAKNKGAALALATAIRQTKCDWILVTDSDGQYPIETVSSMIAAVERDGSLAASGVRLRKADTPFTKFGSKASNTLCNTFHDTDYQDFTCSFKLVDGNLLRNMPLEARGLNYSLEISSRLIEYGVKMLEVDVQHQARLTGRSSSQNIQAAWNRLLFVLYIGFRQFLIQQGVLKIEPLEASEPLIPLKPLKPLSSDITASPNKSKRARQSK